MHLGGNVEDMGVHLVIAGQLCNQSPVAGLLHQLHGLMEGSGPPGYSVDEPHGEWLGGLIMVIGGGGEKVILEDGVPVVPYGSQGEGDWAVAQLDEVCLVHNAIWGRNGKVGEVSLVLFVPLFSCLS